jgi:hypothetical protein
LVLCNVIVEPTNGWKYNHYDDILSLYFCFYLVQVFVSTFNFITICWFTNIIGTEIQDWFWDFVLYYKYIWLIWKPFYFFTHYFKKLHPFGFCNLNRKKHHFLLGFTLLEANKTDFFRPDWKI